ncbi:class I SAM-dependent methyltransferase [Candidatus Poriferisodalis sp.]|uniref:class I SAM-dependent methyltransferase n=1 Tax=Candidatus Poriferisodalis sp. TaxID=3101277 RepID=UPI003B02A736
MLTVDYERLGAVRGDRVLDLGCGAGRHAFESARRGCMTVASDRDRDEVRVVDEMLAAMHSAGELSAAEPDAAELSAGGIDAAPGQLASRRLSYAVVADATALPYPDASFDRIIAAEILEHIVDDELAIAELARVLRPGGTIAITVPAPVSERVCWALSSDYHAPAVPGGHVRIYGADELRAKLASAGLQVADSHGAHGLHTPYWWLRCLAGPQNDENPWVRSYHRLLVWDMTAAPALTRTLDRLLSVVLPKSSVLYACKQMAPSVTAGAPPVGAACVAAGTDTTPSTTVRQPDRSAHDR